MSAQHTSVAAWKMAVRNRTPTLGLIFHSERGASYYCKDFTKLLDAYPKVRQSMSRKGNCWDNAVAESFFRTLKSDCTDHLNRLNIKRNEMSVFEYIESSYNTYRRHSDLNYMTSLECNNCL